ncbi:stage II sporulation protein D [Lysinibacillus sp. 2017]|nr:stage II sporulation protein D [Lysinibacillus sp. 2017]TGN35011.1 stage II sporulation protein D [Lysinibacillus sp. S2017]
MKKILLCIVCILLFLLPLYFVKKGKTEKTEPQVLKESCTLLITVNGQQIKLDDYLIGVLAGEMPVSFHEEALKAQAIAARTYALKQTEYGTKEIKATTAHQVFQTTEERQQKWQTAFKTNEGKLAQAVQESANLVVTYNDQLITAMFHSASQTMTESAENYSGNGIPYLQTVSSPEAQPKQPTLFSFQQLNNLLKQSFKANSYKKIELLRNSTGRVAKVRLNGKTWTGREFRELLSLRSTNFDWQWSANGVTITTYGYGHGVGMSQHGANTMGQSGQTAEQILAHYYPGTVLEEVDFCERQEISD